MSRISAFLVLAVALFVSGCANTRPAQNCVPSSALTLRTPPLLPSIPKDATVNVLVLSGGGFWGAYGAGFLNGWSRRPEALNLPRPSFDLVTGVSTGAIMAPFALLGSSWDEVIRKSYDGVKAPDVLQVRSLWGVLWWNSIGDTKNLQKRLDEALTNSVLEKLAQAERAGRSAWVGATNFDDGSFTLFDISAIAANMPPEAARDQIRNRIMASSSFPVLMPPQFVNGCMYMDGSVRRNLFLPELDTTIRAMSPLTSPQRVRIFAVLNGPAGVVRRRIENSIIPIMSRGVELAIDQNQMAALRDSYDFAQKRGYEFYWTSADAAVGTEKKKGACGALPDPLDGDTGPFTTCLFSLGERAARDATTPWRRDRP